MADLFSIGVNALKYGFDICIHNFLRWLALTVVLIIPILNFVGFGILLKVLRNEEPTFENGGKSFVQGLLAFLIAIIYLLIPFGVQILLLKGSMGPLGVILSLILFIGFTCVLVPALVNFARKQTFLSGFMFNEMIASIKRITLSRFILSLLLIVIAELLLYLIFVIAGIVPFIFWLLIIILIAPFSFFVVKYWNDVFA